ncbi:MAG: TonB-dependent receptor plug domain-containing protein [Sphingobacteriales bacterium]
MIRSILSSTLLLLFFVEQGFAQESQNVISVSKKTENISMAPSSVIKITRKQIIERGYTDIIEVLQDIPGFDINKLYGKSYANFFQLGFRQDNTERTLVMVDGVEENDLYLNVANISRQYPLSAIKEIEVIYGPVSSMYGARGMAGAINIITVEPDEHLNDPLLKKEKPSRLSLYGNVLQGGFKTRSADLTLNVKGKPGADISIQITGKYYKSDEHQMKGEFYDYEPSDIDSFSYSKFFMTNNNWIGGLSKYFIDMKLPLVHPYYTVRRDASGNYTQIALTQEGINRARQLDKAAYTGMVNGAPVGYANSTENYYLGLKMKSGGFTFGIRHWKLIEGNNIYPDLNEAGAKNGSKWAPVNTTVYANMQKKLSDRSEITNLTTFSIHSIDRESNRVNLMAFGEASTNLHFAHLLYPDSLLLGKPGLAFFEHGWRNRYYFYKALQARNELRYFYSSKNEKLHLSSGIDLRYTQTPGDYLIYQDFDTKATSTQAFEDKQRNIFLAKEKGIAEGRVSGLNLYNIFDLGLYAQLSYKITDKFSMVAGARRDQNTNRTSGGYGTKVSPRLTFVYQYNHVFNAKAIYSHGIQSISQWTKYSTDGGKKANPDLKTEHIDYISIELNGQTNIDQTKGFNWNLIGFQYWVNNGIALQTINSLAKIYVHSNKYEISGLMTNISFPLFSKTFLNTNYSFIAPFQTRSIVDSSSRNIRLGDIASHHLNIGLTSYIEHAGPLRASINFRTNYVAGRQVGERTTVPKNIGVNASRTIPDYMIFNGNLGLSLRSFPYLRMDLSVENLFDQLYYHAGPGLANGSFNLFNGIKDTPITDQTVPYQQQRGRFIRIRLSYNIH